MDCVLDIKHAYYINLASRTDRKQHVEEQLRSIGIEGKRFNAVKMKNGAVGCTMSHIKLLEMAKKNQFDHILIVEDDILFTKPNVFVSQFNKFLLSHKTFDVAIIAGNNCPPFFEIDDTCVRVTRCQTTTGYLVQKHYYDTLIKNFKEGLENLIRTPENHREFAIDKYWFNLQAVDDWYLIIPLTVTQKMDYSDIEKRVTNYTPAMLDIDKVAFLRRQREMAALMGMKFS